MITAYLLALAAFMLVAGRVADHYERRRTFLSGLAIFGIASALCAVAPSLELLIAARFVQGAVVAPLALGNTTRAVSDTQRGWAIGVLATGGASFLVLGPLLAGALLTVADWRWLFVVNLPVVVFAVEREARRDRHPCRPPDRRQFGIAAAQPGRGAGGPRAGRGSWRVEPGGHDDHPLMRPVHRGASSGPGPALARTRKRPLTDFWSRSRNEVGALLCRGACEQAPSHCAAAAGGNDVQNSNFRALCGGRYEFTETQAATL